MIHKTGKNFEFLEQLEEDFGQEIENKSSDWLRQTRQQGRTRFKEIGIPSIKDEEWKYTNIASVIANRYVLTSGSDLRESRFFQDYCSKDDLNIVFINGIFTPHLSNLSGIPDGIKISSLKDILIADEALAREWFGQYDLREESAFAVLNRMLFSNGACVQIADKIASKQLIHIIHVTSIGEEKFFNAPRSLIRLGTSSEVTILESHVAFSDEMVYFVDPLTDISLAENAILHYVKIQKESLKAFHVGTTRVRQNRDSVFDGFSLVVGGEISRNNLDVVLSGEGANTILNGLYSVYKDQLADNHTSVDHQVPNATSNQLYKGILNDAARAVFNGKVFVRQIAQRTNSYQLNKNLLMGKDCRVDTKPQLEIFADDVKCTHGVTIGQLNEEEIFYLQTRCISRKEAIRFLTRGFVDDLLNKVSSESIRQRINQLLLPSLGGIG